MKKILIIDDEEEFVTFLKTNLELRGDYEIIFALEGPEGIRIAEKDKPDLILLDIAMPRMDGITATREIRKKLKIPIIILTAAYDAETVQKAKEAGVAAFLTKPVYLSAKNMLLLKNNLPRPSRGHCGKK